MNNSKTLTVFLQSGNPEGIKEITISNKIIKVIVIPRTKLNEINEGISQPALYFLLDFTGEKVYIGESENALLRLRSHEQNKDFWDLAIICLADNNGLEKSDIKYLESIAIEASISSKRSELENRTIPPKNNLSKYKIPVINEFFEDIKLVLSTLGYLFLEEQKKKPAAAIEWYITGRNTKAHGYFDDYGFKVLRGSIIDITESPSLVKQHPNFVIKRKRILKVFGQISVDGKSVVLTSNIPFRSINQAGTFCMGMKLNAWTSWKNKQGVTMDEIIRKGKKL